jgi:hypothetical protein
MTDQFEPWQPVEGLIVNFYLQSLALNGNELTLMMSTSIDDGNRWLKISCRNCFTYRFSQETARLKSLHMDNFGTSPLTRSFNSEYLNWYKEESYGFLDQFNPVHYLILCDDIVDIICASEPLVEWIEDPS